MKKWKNKRGFSIIELIFVSAILIFVLGAFAVLYANFSKFYNRQQAEIEMGNSARETAKELQSAVLQASQIVSSHDFSGTAYSTDADTVVLKIPSIDGSGDIVSGNFDYIVFYLTGKNLYRLVEADATSIRSSGRNQISDAVSGLVYTYNNPNLELASKIDVSLQMQTIAGGQTIFYNLNQEIYLRNL